MDGKRVGHYLIHEQLGRGGMGVVYRATDTRLDRDVALKFLPPEWSAEQDAKARFVQEAKTASSLDHPNICTIHEIGESDEGQLFIVMSFYRGQTLRERLLEGPMPPDQARDIARQLADGLKAAHAAGIIHRDIKPANIMIGEDGRVRILDFGLAKLGHGLDLTKAGSTVGTTAYMSPEQASGEEVDFRADLWSLGVILYEMLAGKRAFGGEYDQAVLYAVINQSPEPLQGVDPELSALVDELLRKAPAERPASAAEVAQRLGSSDSGYRSSTREVSSSNVGRLVGIGVAAVVLIALAFWVFLPASSGDPDEGAVAVDANRVLILPFNFQGDEELSYLSESMGTLLATMLDGTGSIRMVDHALILEQPSVQEAASYGPTLGASLAGRFNAARFVVGSVAKAGSEHRISARLYEADGTSINETLASITGDDDVPAAIDQLASGLVRELLNDPNQDLSSLAAGTTESFEALRHYLVAEQLVRQGEPAEGLVEIEKALALDSTFALAWYLRAEMWGWLDVMSGSQLDDTRKAIKYSGNLSGRAPRILEGELAFQEGRWQEAEAIYEAILRDYPDDLEATGQLAEVYVHFSPREDDQLKALNLFQHVAKLVPGSQQFGFHESDLLAFQGLLDGDLSRLDSLAASYAGMPLPQDEEQLDWSRALDRMRPESADYMTKFALLRGTPEDSISALSRSMNQFSPYELLGYGFIDAGEVAMGHPDIFGTEEIVQQLVAQSRGQIAESFSFAYQPNNSEYHTDSWFLWRIIVWASLPVIDWPPEMLAELSTMRDSFERAPDIPRPEVEATLAYIDAQSAFQRGDRAGVDAALQAFVQAHPDDSPLWGQIESELSALGNWMDGRVEEAIVLMKKALLTGIPARELGDNPLEIRHQPYWYLAQLNEEAGRLEEAVEWYKAVLMRSDYAPFGWEQAARVYEELGDNDNAIRYYTLMARQWEDADDMLQPRVEAARARVEVLLDQKAQEPAQ